MFLAREDRKAGSGRTSREKLTFHDARRRYHDQLSMHASAIPLYQKQLALLVTMKKPCGDLKTKNSQPGTSVVIQRRAASLLIAAAELARARMLMAIGRIVICILMSRSSRSLTGV